MTDLCVRRGLIVLSLLSQTFLIPVWSQPKQDPSIPAAPQLPPGIEMERQRFLYHLQRARPMEMPTTPSRRLDATAPGAVVTFDPNTGQVTPRESNHAAMMLPGAPVVPPGEPRLSAVPVGAGDGPMGLEGQRSRERVAGGADAAPQITPTQPGPFAYPYSHPWNTTYKLLMLYPSGDSRVCSAASASSFHLLTAGHCLFNGAFGGWAVEIWAWAAQTDVVYPISVADYPYGVAKMTQETTYNAWINSSDLNWDIGWIALDRRMGDHTGWMGRETGNNTNTINFNGYPVEPAFIPSNQNLFQFPGGDSGNVREYYSNRIALDAFIYGGHSGGPEWRFDGTNRWIQGVNSTSNRAGYAEGTRYNNTVHADLNNTIANDNVVRPPVNRPDLIEYVFNTTSKDLLSSSATIGSSLGVVYNIFNAGFDNSGALNTHFYLTRSPSFATYDYFVGSKADAALGAYTFVVNSTYLTIPNYVPPGTYYVGYAMTGTTAEASYDNNNVVIGRTVTIGCPADGYESDNTAGTAKLLTAGVAQSHAICGPADEDWVRFTLPSTSSITLSTDGASGDSLLFLYNSSLGQIAADDDSGNNLFSMITRSCASDPLPAGTYYAKVASYGGAASIPNYRLSLSATACPMPAVLSVTVPSALTGGNNGSGRVTLAAAAPVGGAVVALTRNNAVVTIPASVTVAAGATFVDFPVSTTGVAAAVTVTVSATGGGVTRTDTIVVNPAALSALTIAPTSVFGPTGATGTITLTGFAPPGGATVVLTDNSAATGVPASVVVPAGTATRTFAVTTLAVVADTTSTVTASYRGVDRSRPLLVKTPDVATLTLAPNVVLGGAISVGTVTLTSPAPAAGAVVTLASANTAAATVPATVTVPSGATTANFNVTSKPVGAVVNVAISATRGGITRSANLRVNPPAVSLLTLTPATVRGGSSSTGTVTLTGKAPAGGAVVTLLSSNPAAATVPISVTVPGGATSRNFVVTTVPVGADTTSTIRATYLATYKTSVLSVTR